MAKSAWCAVSPMSGKENAPINVTLPAYTGRLARNTIATATNKNGTKPSKAITVNQAAAGNILTLDATKPDVATVGGSVTVNGTSNSSKLNWFIEIKPAGATDNGYIALDIPGLSAVVKVNNTAIVKDTAITGDPGKNGAYNLVSTLTIPASPFPVDVVLRILFRGDGGEAGQKSCVMTWKAGSSTISVDKTSLNFTASGGTQTVNITSNDEWEIS